MRFSKAIARSLSLITLGGVLFIVATANRAETVPLPITSAAVSPTPLPTPSSEPKRPNPVRRFFSSVIHGVTGLFRRPDRVVCRLPPTVSLTSSSSLITICPPGMRSLSATCSSSREVTLAANATDPESDKLLYTWEVTGGRLISKGRILTWDLGGLPEGTYTATVEVNDGHQHTAATSTAVTVARCSECVWVESPCPILSVSCPSAVDSKQAITFVATVSGGDVDLKPTYTWALTAGKIISGQGTSKITIDASDVPRSQSITATVTLGGINPSCLGNTASCTIIDMLPRH